MKIQRDQQTFPGLTKYAEVFGGFDEEIKGRNVTVSCNLQLVRLYFYQLSLSSVSSVINDAIVTINIIIKMALYCPQGSVRSVSS